uniref:RNA (guanine-9-)-methyltransferase domain-containing protein 1 n=1 Tax=Saccoglossus kowalevskii TaxID=10224 RepID=A0ABM0GUX2_SACKO|nr:PREDICTED: mitochondrial ribonuclease P protein 1-like [Saccoglossus kowalevskii]
MLRPASLAAVRRVQSSICCYRRKLLQSYGVLQMLPDMNEMYRNNNAIFHQPNVHLYHSTRALIGSLYSPDRRYCTDKTADKLNTMIDGSNADCDESIQEIGEYDEEIKNALMLIDMWRRSGKYVPEKVTDEQLRYFSKLTTKSARKKYLSLLARKELLRQVSKEKKERNAEILSKRKEENLALGRKFDKNTIFIYLSQSTMSNQSTWNMVRGMLFESSIVLDFDYEHVVNPREITAAVKQLTDMLGAMKTFYEPFHMHWTSIRPGGAYELELNRIFKDYLDRAIIDISHKSFMDLFPKDKLVYLSADSPNVLTHYDPDKVYIIGVMVDLSIRSGVSFAKSKRLGIQSARLPLDQHVKWSKGAKNLTIDQMVKIMLELKKTNNWKDALQYVPSRKIEGFYKTTEHPFAGNNKRRKPSRKEMTNSSHGNFSFSRVSRPIRDENKDQGPLPPDFWKKYR